MPTPKIAVVDDDRNAAKLIGMLLEDEGYEVAIFNDAASCLNSVWNTPYDLLLVDYRMPHTDGIELLTQIKKYHPEAVVVMLTAYGTIEVAVKAMQLGAYDFITKPIDREALKLTVQNAIRFAQLTAENRHLREELSARYRFENLVGKSLPMQEVFQQIRKVAQTDTTVLILGETGTGKELVAKAIHYNSQRRGKFVAVDCSALPKELVASELFGYKKGAFTGAIADKKGRFELAHGGTLFLDEVGEIPLMMQVQLLRALQEKTIMPLGGTQEITVDVRLIAATNAELRRAVDAGTFRSDLYYRLNVFPIVLPPLRSRKGDIPLLIRHFLNLLSLRRIAPEHADQISIHPKAYQALTAYAWPGNVRELENVIESALVLSDGGDIHLEHLPETVWKSPKSLHPLQLEIPDEGISLEEVEKTLLKKALDKTGGNQTRAAQLLGIKRHALIYRMEKFQLDKNLEPKPPFLETGDSESER